MKIILFLFLFFYLISLISASECNPNVGYCNPNLPFLNSIPSTTTSTNNNTLNVNNSIYLQGLTPNQVANLFIETDPVFSAWNAGFLYNYNQSSTLSMNYSNIALINQTNTFNLTQVINGNLSAKVTNLTLLQITPTTAVIGQNSLLRLKSNSATNGYGVAIDFIGSTADTGITARIASNRTGTSGLGDLIFYTIGGPPPTESMRINSTGVVTINNLKHSSGNWLLYADPATGQLSQLAAYAITTTGAWLTLRNAEASSSTGGSIIMMGVDDNAALADGDRLGQFIYQGSYKAGGFVAPSASVEAFANGAWSDTSTPTQLDFKVTPSGSIGSIFTRVTAMSIRNDKSVFFFGDTNFSGDMLQQVLGKKFYMGTTKQSSISYNGSDMLINPKEIGSGKVYVQGQLDVQNNYSVGGVQGITGNYTILKDVDLVGLTKTFCNMTINGGIITNSSC